MEKRSSHLWHAHKFCKEQMGCKRFTDSELERNIGVLQRMMLKVAKHMAAQLREEGVWKNASDERWPRNHKGSDPDHWYDSGSFPPQFLALPTNDPTSWREVLRDNPESLFDEMIAWAETPAGQAGVGDEELQKLLADRDTYLPEPERKKAEPAPASDGLPTIDGSPQADRDRTDGLDWLSDKSADGSLFSWAGVLKLEGIDKYLRGASLNRRSIERMLPDLMVLEKSGEWELLHSHLLEKSPADAKELAKLRKCLPKVRGA